MGKYVENNIGKQEQIVYQGEVSGIIFLPHFILMLFVIGFFTIIGAIIVKTTTELAITNKNVYGKVGWLSTKNMTSPLNKVQNVSVATGLSGKIFGYGTVEVTTASGKYKYGYIKNPEEFKKTLLNQIDAFDEERIRKQAEQLAGAMNRPTEQ